MSTIKSIYLQHLNGTVPNATMDTNGNFTVGGTVSGASSNTFRNRIINGAMVIDQRNAGASANNQAATVFSVDRWQTFGTQATKFSFQQNAGSVTPPPGFTNYLGITSLSSYSITSTDFNYVAQTVEGYSVADLDLGKSTCKSLTLSFWVRSSLTGTFGGSFYQSGTRNFPFSYVINSANTWEYKTIVISPDTSGTSYATTTAAAFYLIFGLGTGATYSSGAAGSWQTSNNIQASGTVSLLGTQGATWYITGVQLEAGTVATPFEYRDIATEVRLCYRYHYRTRQYVNTAQMWIAPGAVIATTQARYNMSLPTTMRTFPAISVTPAYNTGSSWQINVSGINNYAWTAAPTILDYDNGAAGNPIGASSICFLATASGISGSYIGLGSVPYMPTGVNTNQIILDAEI